MDELEMDRAVLNAADEGGKITMAASPKLSGAVAAWWPMLASLAFQFGIKLAADTLPVLKERLESWQPKGGLMKLLKRQLLVVIDEAIASLKKDPSLGDLMFAEMDKA